MDAAEFRLLRGTLKSLSERHEVRNFDELRPEDRKQTREALDQLGLAELRAGSPPMATVQECAVLAADFGGFLLGTSFLGTTLLAPELRRLAGCDAEADLPPSTIGLGSDLGLTMDRASLGWDAEGVETALLVRSDGSVWRGDLGDAVSTADPLRMIRQVVGDSTAPLGQLGADTEGRWRAFALTMISGEMLGAGQKLLEQTIEYARERQQYGQPIAHFQAVQHLLADAYVLVETASSAIRYAAWSLDHEPVSKALRSAVVAKAYTNEAAVESIRLCMQVFGGIAQTWEHTAHRFLRRCILDSSCAGRTAQLQVELATWPEES